jgi:cytochrome c-type biogenesis protein CcmH/NrfG
MEESLEESSEPRSTGASWTAAQTYTMAAICLVIGLVIGYFVRGSASPAPQVPQAAGAMPSGAASGMGQQRAMPTLADMKRMADKQAEPLLAQLKEDPKNVQALNKTALMYQAAHQFREAIVYFQKALAIDPKNVPIRTDMASCMYYLGDVDGAIAELQKSLSYDPKHAGTLMNLGIIKWQGKNDTKGAIVAWQTLLKADPDFPQKKVVESLIAQAKQQEQNAATASLQPKD